MKLWNRLLSLFLLLQVFVGNALVGNSAIVPNQVTTAKPAAAKPVSAPAAIAKPVSHVTAAKPATTRRRVRRAAPKPVVQPQGNVVTKLTSQQLQKYELSGVNKKDWAQRLQWFESKIVNHYKGLNKKNILVVGPQKFLDAFKAATQKHNWQANFTYAPKANSPEIAGRGLDLVIDAQYIPRHFKRIYGNLNVSSFKDVYAEILYDETLTFLEKNGVKYYFFERPVVSKIKNLDDIDKYFSRLSMRDLADAFFGSDRKHYKEKIVETLYRDNQENYEYMKYYRRDAGKMRNNGKYGTQKDESNKFFNVLNGKRITAFKNATTYKNGIYFFGPCIICGWGVTDAYTIESFLQKHINNINNQYECINSSGPGGVLNDFEYMLNTEYKPGDIVINIPLDDGILRKILRKHNINIFETSHLFNRPHNHGHWLLDGSGYHINHNGNKVIANYIYEVLKPQLSKAGAKAATTPVKYQFENEADTFLDDNPDFKRYLEGLKTIKAQTKATGKVGSIVMNCNPFTLGHRYLIERAAAQVEHLYIFVVEEDKSVFPFKDRLELVKKGTADLGDKVTILPSGKWIISLLTFPEYFNKDDLQGAAIDPSKDINLFGKYIAPTLGINMRFVGEEPFDKVTRQYNETMKNILPSFGVSFHEIPRKSIDGKDDVISATKVRNALKTGDFETLKKYVPESTLIYLKENHKPTVKLSLNTPAQLYFYYWA